MRLHPIGMRTIKTGIAVSLTLLLTRALGVDNPFFALIASAIAMESSVSESVSVGKNRMIGTVIGAVIAIVFSYTLPTQPLSVGIGVIVLIYISNQLKLKKSIKISTIVFIAILVNNDEVTRFQYAVFRSFDTFIGLSIGTLVNYYIKPPNGQKSLYAYIEASEKKLQSLIDQYDRGESIGTYEDMLATLMAVEKKRRTLINDQKLFLYDASDLQAIHQAFENIKKGYTHLSVLVSLEGATEAVRAYHLNALKHFKNSLS